MNATRRNIENAIGIILFWVIHTFIFVAVRLTKQYNFILFWLFVLIVIWYITVTIKTFSCFV